MKAGEERGERKREAAAAGLASLAGGFESWRRRRLISTQQVFSFFQVSDAQMRRSSSDYKSIILENHIKKKKKTFIPPLAAPLPSEDRHPLFSGIPRFFFFKKIISPHSLFCSLIVRG